LCGAPGGALLSRFCCSRVTSSALPLPAVATGAKTSTKATAKIATPWGPAAVVEEVKVGQQAGEKEFASIFQLLVTKQGEQLVRIAYTTDGIVRRGPVTLRARDVNRLQAALRKKPALGEALGLGGDA
jgi:hypothetical protein